MLVAPIPTRKRRTYREHVKRRLEWLSRVFLPSKRGQRRRRGPRRESESRRGEEVDALERVWESHGQRRKGERGDGGDSQGKGGFVLSWQSAHFDM